MTKRCNVKRCVDEINGKTSLGRVGSERALAERKTSLLVQHNSSDLNHTIDLQVVDSESINTTAAAATNTIIIIITITT